MREETAWRFVTKFDEAYSLNGNEPQEYLGGWTASDSTGLNYVAEAKGKPKLLVECAVCLRKLSTREILKRHLRDVHQMNENLETVDIKTFLCPLPTCMRGKPFKRASQLYAHMEKVHNRDRETLRKSKEPLQAMKSQQARMQNSQVSSFASFYPAVGSGDTCLSELSFDDMEHFSYPAGLGASFTDLEDSSQPSINTHIVGNPLGFHSEQETMPESMTGLEFDGLSKPVSFMSRGVDTENGKTDSAILRQDDLALGGENQDNSSTFRHLEESSEAEYVPGESNEQVKQKMMSIIQIKYAELNRIDEQIRLLQELQSRRREVTKDIKTLEGSLQKVLPSI